MKRVIGGYALGVAVTILISACLYPEKTATSATNIQAAFDVAFSFFGPLFAIAAWGLQ